jgi:hypothetical protein
MSSWFDWLHPIMPPFWIGEHLVAQLCLVGVLFAFFHILKLVADLLEVEILVGCIV